MHTVSCPSAYRCCMYVYIERRECHCDGRSQVQSQESQGK
jgi:hypothetical protein